MATKAPNMPLIETGLPKDPAAPGTDADQPSVTGENLLKIACDENGDAHYCSSTRQSKKRKTSQITSSLLDDTDKPSHAAHDQMKASVTSDTGSNTFAFMRLPPDIRLCVYDQLVAMSVARSLVGPHFQIYHAKPSVGVLRVSRLVREEAYPIIERGRLKRCPSLIVKVPANSSRAALSQYLYRIVDLMGDLAYWFRRARREDNKQHSAFNEMHRSTLLSLHQWIEGVVVNDWEGATEHRDNKAATFEFFKRAILSLQQGTFSMHVIINSSALLLDDSFKDWFRLLETLNAITATCLSFIDGMLRVSVPADCIARMRTVLSTPHVFGRGLHPDMWKVDVL